MRLLVAGDSLSCPRQKEGIVREMLYANLVHAGGDHDASSVLANLSVPGITVSQSLKACERELADQSTGSPGTFDLAVVQLGVVDCPYRTTPLRVKSVVSRLPAGPRKRIVAWLHRNRHALINHGPKWSYTPLPRFLKQYGQLVRLLKRHADRVVLIDIFPPGAYFIEHSPHIESRILAYNEVIARVARDEKVTLIDTRAFCDRHSDHDVVSAHDGHHLTPDGHRLLAEEIQEILGG